MINMILGPNLFATIITLSFLIIILFPNIGNGMCSWSIFLASYTTEMLNANILRMNSGITTNCCPALLFMRLDILLNLLRMPLSIQCRFCPLLLTMSCIIFSPVFRISQMVPLRSTFTTLSNLFFMKGVMATMSFISLLSMLLVIKMMLFSDSLLMRLVIRFAISRPTQFTARNKTTFYFLCSSKMLRSCRVPPQAFCTLLLGNVLGYDIHTEKANTFFRHAPEVLQHLQG